MMIHYFVAVTFIRLMCFEKLSIVQDCKLASLYNGQLLETTKNDVEFLNMCKLQCLNVTLCSIYSEKQLKDIKILLTL